MQLSTRHDVETPADALFDGIADFDRIERMMIRRGAKVTRVAPAAGSPMAWDLQFDWRGRKRDMRMSVTRYDRPDLIEMQGISDSFGVTLTANVVALSRQRSRLMLVAVIDGRSLKARLMLQTARLTRSSLEHKFGERVAHYVDTLPGLRQRG